MRTESDIKQRLAFLAEVRAQVREKKSEPLAWGILKDIDAEEAALRWVLRSQEAA